jgi:exopolysaccharide biosynthesis polyprenyl glycosylphosphotransferase
MEGRATVADVLTNSALLDDTRVTTGWSARYARRLWITDLLAITWAVVGAQLFWFGLDFRSLGGADGMKLASDYTIVSVVVIAAWVVALQVFGSRAPRVIGTDVTEYKLVVTSSLGLFGAIAAAAYLFDVGLARGYFLTALPFGLVVILASRWMWRQWLRVRRTRGDYSYRVVLVGSALGSVHLARELTRNPTAGYHIIGAVVLGGGSLERLPGTKIPVWTDLEQLPDLLDELGADTVAVTPSDELSPERIREISWSLEPGRRHLVVAPSLTDIGGPRIHTRPVSGLPLIHVETPRYEGRKLYAKRAFDLVASSLLLAILAPVLLTIAVVVKLTSPGPVFFRQARVGKNGDEFTMLKFRTMVVDAEERLAALRDDQRNAGNTVMFKMKDDPRITSVGTLLRRFSLDELPQLINVWTGSMSLVGPRPPLLREVQQYESRVHRRFLVKPGITGLWQVSGRSNLSWEETVRLDLYYVENWSLTGDFIILWRTSQAVVAREGAY